MIMWPLCALLLLCAHAAFATTLKELKAVHDSISFTKSADTVVIGLFEDNKSDDWKIFKQV
jgi:hypothetical protein